jgi:hypothetical protein
VLDLMKACCVDKNKVAIVTNARLTWVYFSSLLLLPKTAEFIKGKVHVVTARVDGLNLPSNEWKIPCFMILYESLNFDVGAVNNIIVIGDSMNEITAG